MRRLTNIMSPKTARSVASANLSDEASIRTWVRNYIFRPAGTLAKSELRTPNEQR